MEIAMQRGACSCCACGHRGAGTGGEVPGDELDGPLPDLEKGRGRDHTAVAPTMTADAMAEATRAALLDAYDVEMGKATSKTFKCFSRGLIVLLWVYLIDFMRRYVVTHSVEELFFTICPLGILVVALSMFFCILMGSIDKYFPPILPRPY